MAKAWWNKPTQGAKGAAYRGGVYSLLSGVNTLRAGINDAVEGLSPEARARRAASKAKAEHEQSIYDTIKQESSRAEDEAKKAEQAFGIAEHKEKAGLPEDVGPMFGGDDPLPASFTAPVSQRSIPAASLAGKPAQPPPGQIPDPLGMLKFLDLPPEAGVAAPPPPAPDLPRIVPQKPRTVRAADLGAAAAAARERATAIKTGDFGAASRHGVTMREAAERENPEAVLEDTLALGKAMESPEALAAYEPRTKAGKAAKVKALEEVSGEVRKETGRQKIRTEAKGDLGEQRTFDESKDRDDRIRKDRRRREVMQDQEVLVDLEGLSPEAMKAKKPKFQSPEGWDAYMELLGKSQEQRDAFLASVGFARDPDDPKTLYEVVGKGAGMEKPSVTQDQYIQDQIALAKERATGAKQDLDVLLDPMKGRGAYETEEAYQAALSAAQAKAAQARRAVDTFDYDKVAGDYRTKYGTQKTPRTAPGAKPAGAPPAPPKAAAPPPAPPPKGGAGEADEVFLERIEKKVAGDEPLSPEEEARLAAIEGRKGGPGGPESKSVIIDERGEGGQVDPKVGAEKSVRFERTQRALKAEGLDEASRKRKYQSILDGTLRADLVDLSIEEREVAAGRESEADERRIAEILNRGKPDPEVERRAAASKAAGVATEAEKKRKADLLEVARKKRLGSVYDLVPAR